MQNDNTLIESVKLLISRLEHLSADSRYAHRASGLRGSLWRCLEEMEDGSQCNCLTHPFPIDRSATVTHPLLRIDRSCTAICLIWKG